ncbi:MAG TPA: zinc ribbon domain-containing protein [Caldilineaceae bacterium]|nr:zinc ribbon domain-containing protein [Caldilineaceae bacterium]
MPIYEYFCTSCQATFETIRPAQQADQPCECPACRKESKQRVLSLVATSVVATGSSDAPMMTASSGGGCCGGACGCHH